MILSIIALAIGIVFGRFFTYGYIGQSIGPVITALICVVVLCAGFSIGSNKTIVCKLKQYKAKVLLVPAGALIGSIAGGLIAGAVLGMRPGESMSISVGMGFYSLSAGILTDLGAPQLASLSFLVNSMREMIALVSIPFISKYVHYLSSVAAGGATSMDTTLPVISRSTNDETVVMALLSGTILTILVPILTPVVYTVF